MVSKLVEWLTAFVLFASIWSAFIFDMVPIELDPRIKEVIVPLPVYLVIVFGAGMVYEEFKSTVDDTEWSDQGLALTFSATGQKDQFLSLCFSLATIGYRVATFNDCEEAAASLKKEIEEARKDLTKKGFKFT